MARLSSSTRSRSRDRSWHARPLPWAITAQAATVLRDHWPSISPADRTRLAALLRQSGGRPMLLTPQQRTEVGKIIARSDLARMSAPAGPVASRRSPARRASALRRA